MHDDNWDSLEAIERAHDLVEWGRAPLTTIDHAKGYEMVFKKKPTQVGIHVRSKGYRSPATSPEQDRSAYLVFSSFLESERTCSYEIRTDSFGTHLMIQLSDDELSDLISKTLRYMMHRNVHELQVILGEISDEMLDGKAHLEVGMIGDK